MKRPECRLPVLLLVALGLLVLGSEVALPQARAQTDAIPFRQGTHGFRRIVYEVVGPEQLTALSSVEELGADPKHTLLIVLGETAILEKVPDGLHSFVQRGGAALVASDRPVSAQRLSPEFNTTITGEAVEVRVTARSPGYRDRADCPYVQFLPHEGLPSLRKLQSIATNRPSCLARSDGRSRIGLPLLALFSNECFIKNSASRFRQALAFATGGNEGEGRILVLADHSVFINDMLSQPDNDNFTFATLCLEWLTDGGRRNRVLFVEEDLVQTQFDVPLKEVPPPLPSLGAILHVINTGLHGLEEENAFNRFLANRLEAVPQRQLLQGLVLMLTLWLMLYGLVRIGQARHKIDPGAPLLDPALTQAAPARAVVPQRQQEMVTAGALWEPARALARHWFEDALGPLLPLIEERERQGLRPLFKVRVTGGLWRRWSWGRQVRRLWRLARGGTPRRVSAREFATVKQRLLELAAAEAQGVLRFEVPPAS